MTRPGRVAIVAAGLLVAATGCAARRLPVPAAARVASPGGVAAWESATEACRNVRAYSSTIRLAGRINSERIPAGLSVAAGLNDAGGLRFEARMVGRRVFTLAGTPERAVLLLHREREVAVGPASELLEALFGTALDPGDLLAILSGCGTPDRTASEIYAVGDLIEVVTGRARVYLERSPGGWRPRLAFVAGLQVDFTRFDGRWPGEIRVWTEPGAQLEAELRFRIETVEVNSFTLSSQALELAVPAEYTQVDVDAVRRAVSRREE